MATSSDLNDPQWPLDTNRDHPWYPKASPASSPVYIVRYGTWMIWELPTVPPQSRATPGSISTMVLPGLKWIWRFADQKASWEQRLVPSGFLQQSGFQSGQIGKNNRQSPFKNQSVKSCRLGLPSLPFIFWSPGIFTIAKALSQPINRLFQAVKGSLRVTEFWHWITANKVPSVKGNILSFPR